MPKLRKREMRRAANARYDWYDEMTHPTTEAEPEHQLYPFTEEQDKLIHKNHLKLFKEIVEK